MRMAGWFFPGCRQCDGVETQQRAQRSPGERIVGRHLPGGTHSLTGSLKRLFPLKRLSHDRIEMV